MPVDESIRKGRTFTVNQSVVTLGAASGTFLSANANRVGIIFGPNNTNRFTISSLATAVIDQGITVGVGGATQYLRVEDWGALVTGALTGVASGAGTNVGIIEIIGN